MKFLQSSRLIVAEMQGLLASGDLEMLGRLSHRHKSAAGSVGALGFFRLCVALEQAAKVNDRNQAAALVGQIPLLIDRIALQLELLKS